ncbi:MAG: 2,3-diphosphoglycerate-dependent phosphoglycerate mutase [Candidatus Paceibacterota bacterium]|jgi:2,3-bisphosphoglycerate-dependent phosphoglycerate mutase
MIKVVFIRHGQTDYNKNKIFCGWTDAELNEEGIKEAHNAGKILKDNGYVFDIAFTSVLKRAIDTAKIIIQEIGQNDLPIKYSWRLNERHYGALQGQKHEDVAKIEGKEQVHIWRRSYSVKPPQLKEDDPRYPGFDPKYKDLDRSILPRGESLEDTMNRTIPYWNDEILPDIKAGKRVIVSASGNSLRAIIKYIDEISDEDIVALEIATGMPIVYEIDENSGKPIGHYNLDK